MTRNDALRTLCHVRFRHAYYNDVDGFLDDEGFGLHIVPTPSTARIMSECGIKPRYSADAIILAAAEAVVVPDRLEFELNTDRLDLFQITAFEGVPLPADHRLEVSVTLGSDGGHQALCLYALEDTPASHRRFGRLVIEPCNTAIHGVVDVTFDSLQVQRHCLVVASDPGIDLDTVWLSRADKSPLPLTRTQQRIDDRFDAVLLASPKTWPLRQIAFDPDLMWLHYETVEGQEDRTVVPEPDIDTLQQIDGVMRSVSRIYL